MNGFKITTNDDKRIVKLTSSVHGVCEIFQQKNSKFPLRLVIDIEDAPAKIKIEVDRVQ